MNVLVFVTSSKLLLLLWQTKIYNIPVKNSRMYVTTIISETSEKNTLHYIFCTKLLFIKKKKTRKKKNNVSS